jgi:hypothetical protein
MIGVRFRLLFYVFLIYILLNFSFKGVSAGCSPGCDSCETFVDNCSEGQFGDYYNISICCCNNDISCSLPVYAKNYTIKGGLDSESAVPFAVNNNSDDIISILCSSYISQYHRDERRMKIDLGYIWNSLGGSTSEPYNMTINKKFFVIKDGTNMDNIHKFVAIYYPTPEKQVRIITSLDRAHFEELIKTLNVEDKACE